MSGYTLCTLIGTPRYLQRSIFRFAGSCGISSGRMRLEFLAREIGQSESPVKGGDCLALNATGRCISFACTQRNSSADSSGTWAISCNLLPDAISSTHLQCRNYFIMNKKQTAGLRVTKAGGEVQSLNLIRIWSSHKMNFIRWTSYCS